MTVGVFNAWGPGNQMTDRGDNYNEISMSDPVLVHVHLPKTAGTTIREQFEKSLGPAHRNLYSKPHSYVYTEDALWDEALADFSVRSISSHFIRRFPPFIRGRRLLYYTFLRDPTQQFLSYYTYIRKVYPQITDEELLRSLPENAHLLSSREFAAWLLRSPFDIAFRENYTTNFLARFVWMAASGKGPQSQLPWPQEWNRDDWASYCLARTEVAKDVLSSFFFVGFAEHIDSGFHTLRTRATELGISLTSDGLSPRNVSAELRDDTRWIEPSDPIGQCLIQNLQSDFNLYEFAPHAATGAVQEPCRLAGTSDHITLNRRPSIRNLDLRAFLLGNLLHPAPQYSSPDIVKCPTLALA